MRVGDDVMLSAQKVWTTLWWTTSETKLPAWWAEREREREGGQRIGWRMAYKVCHVLLHSEKIKATQGNPPIAASSG
jgi:hypothetical protein